MMKKLLISLFLFMTIGYSQSVTSANLPFYIGKLYYIKMHIDSLLVADSSSIYIEGVGIIDTSLIGYLNQAESITGNWINTDNPWADNEVANDITVTNYTLLSAVRDSIDIRIDSTYIDVKNFLPDAQFDTHEASATIHHTATVSGDIDHDLITGVSTSDHHIQTTNTNLDSLGVDALGFIPDLEFTTHKTSTDHDGQYYTETEEDTWRSSVTQTEMSYLNGTTSDIQMQFGNKQASDNALSNISGLVYVSPSFIKLTANDTYAVRTLSETKTDLDLSGTNTGDQTSIVGITGTKAQFNTAVTDGDIAYSGGAFHDGFSDFVGNEHLDWTASVSTIHIDNYIEDDDITIQDGSTTISTDANYMSFLSTDFVVADAVADSVTVAIADGGIDHDATANFDSDEHVAHGGVTLTAGDGLSGGGTIASNRTFTVLLDFDSGLETVDDSVNVKLDGVTLTKAVAGLKVTDNTYQPLEATLTDIADGTINENLINTANPWAANEIVSTVIHESELSALETDPNVDTEAEIEAITGAFFGTSKAVTSGYIWVADGVDFESVIMSGEATIAFGGAITLDNNALDDQYYDSEGDLTALLDDNYEAELNNSAGLLAALDNETGTLLSVFSGSPTFTTDIEVKRDDIKVTQSDAYGILLSNAQTATAADSIQYSPPIIWEGTGWKTGATAASQKVEFRAYVKPVEGTSAPSGDWVLESSINDGAYSTLLTVQSDGNTGIDITNPYSKLVVDGDIRFMPRKQQALVTFIFDDGNESDYTVMKPLFDGQGEVACSAIMTDTIGVAGRLSSAQIIELETAGWEILSHTVTHAHLPDSTDAVIRTELSDSKDVFEGLGLTIKNIVYPYNEHNETVRRIAREYYRSGRSGDFDVGLNPYALNTFKLSSRNIDVEADSLIFKALVDEAESQKKWLIFYMHNTVTIDSIMVLSLINYIQSKSILIVTINQGLDLVGNMVDVGDVFSVGEKAVRLGGVVNITGDVKVEGRLSIGTNDSVHLLEIETAGLTGAFTPYIKLESRDADSNEHVGILFSLRDDGYGKGMFTFSRATGYGVGEFGWYSDNTADDSAVTAADLVMKLYPTGDLWVYGKISAATYGSDGSVTDAELLYINTLSGNAQDAIDLNTAKWTITGSDIYYNTGNVGIGTDSPSTTNGGLDIASGGLSLIIGADISASTRTNSTNKWARFGGYHYTNAEEPVALIVSEVTSTENRVHIGGRTGSMNAATSVEIWTGANNTTTSGTVRVIVDSDGNVDFSGTTIDMVTSGTVLTVGVGADNGTVSAGIFTDRTPFYDGDALTVIKNIKGKNGRIDHITLPTFVQAHKTKDIFESQKVKKPKKDEDDNDVLGSLGVIVYEDVLDSLGNFIYKDVKVGTEDYIERNIGNMISVNVKALQQLIVINEDLTKRIEKLESL